VPAIDRKWALVTDAWLKSVANELLDDCGGYLSSQLSLEWRRDGDAKSDVFDSSDAEEATDAEEAAVEKIYLYIIWFS